MSLECATIFAAAFVRCKEKPQTLIINSCGFKGESAEKVKCANLFALALYCLASIDKLPLKMFVLVDRLAVYLVVSCDRHSWALAMLGAQPRRCSLNYIVRYTAFLYFKPDTKDFFATKIGGTVFANRANLSIFYNY